MVWILLVVKRGILPFISCKRIENVLERFLMTGVPKTEMRMFWFLAMAALIISA